MSFKQAKDGKYGTISGDPPPSKKKKRNENGPAKIEDPKIDTLSPRTEKKKSKSKKAASNVHSEKGSKPVSIRMDVNPSKTSQASFPKAKKKTNHLLLLLALNLFIPFGQNYVFDFPQALAEPMMTSLRIDTDKISWLYTMYSLPNMIFSPITGYIIELIGCNNSAVVYTAITFIGQAIIYYGVVYQSYWYVFVGRGLYGIGGEGLTILQLTINELWFYGNFLSASVAWCDIFAIMGLLGGNFFNPQLFTAYRSLHMCFFVSCMICFFSFSISFVYYFVHNKYVHLVTHEHDDSLSELSGMGQLGTKKAQALGMSATEDKLFDNEEDNVEKIQLQFGFRSIKYFNATFWLLCLVFLALANCYYQFTNIATEVLQNRFMYSYESASNFTVIPELAFIIVSAPLSTLIETHGRKPLWMLICSIMFLTSYLWMYFMPFQPSNLLYVHFSMLGVGFAILTCALFSSVALSIPKAGVSMGYSILTLVENIGLSSLPPYFGYISRDRTKDAYNECILSLVVLSILSVILCSFLVLYDTKNTRLLTLPENSKRVRKLRKNIDSDYLERSVRDLGDSFNYGSKSFSKSKPKANKSLIQNRSGYPDA